MNKNAFALLAAGFSLNLLWEYAHWPLYSCAQRRPCCRLPMTLIAAGMDAALVGAIHSVGVRAFSDNDWTVRLDKRKALFALAAGALTGTLIERMALAGLWWEYSEKMPRLFGVGVLPVLQMTTLPLTAFWLAAKLERK